MRAKHLFVASELGVFESLASGPKPLDELARASGCDATNARIIVDAVTALSTQSPRRGFFEREGDRCRNGPVAQALLSGQGPVDMRPFIRFWSRLSYRRWLTLEDSVRLDRGTSGEFNFTADEQKIFSEGVEAFSVGHASALAEAYDFSRHRRILDLGGSTGLFLRAILERHAGVEGTLYELPQAAAIARQKLKGTACERGITILEEDFLEDPPRGARRFSCRQCTARPGSGANQQLFRRVRAAAPRGARLLLLDVWTNAAHTEPLFAALMAGEFLVVGGNGDVCSIEEVRSWLDQTGWRFVGHKLLGEPASLVIAEATGE